MTGLLGLGLATVGLSGLAVLGWKFATQLDLEITRLRELLEHDE